MDKEQKETKPTEVTRSKLTLKLKLPAASDPKVISTKNAENKRISNSLVQVTIKGRKKDSPPAISENKIAGKGFIKKMNHYRVWTGGKR